MRVSLIITTYNRPNALFLVLQSIKGQTKLPDEIIIADDGGHLTWTIQSFKVKIGQKLFTFITNYQKLIAVTFL